jgi:predicted DNA-binding WGR domain protein
MGTAVIYRTYPDGDVVALFPETPASVTDPHLINCYAHIGQHGQADYTLVVRDTRPATDEEADRLRRELEAVGYDDLERHERRSPQMQQRALKAWRKAC